MTNFHGETQHLYLVRHGQTALNAEGRLRGLANPPLDELGLREANLLARVLAENAPFVVYSSPLQRAVSTADAIARAAGVANHPDERFNDRDYGPQTGRLKSEVVGEWGSVDAAPGVEATSAVLARARPALDAVLDSGTDAVVVTHDAVIRPLLQHLDHSRKSFAVPTGSWNHLTRTSGKWTLLAVDQIPPDLPESP